MHRRRNTRLWLFDRLEDRTLLSFNAAHSFPTGSYPASVAVGDFNGDGKPDLVTANVDGNDVSVLLGNGDGTFQTAGYDFDTDPYNYSYPSPRSVAVEDFNGDGKPDLATAVFYGGHGPFYGEVNVLLGNGNGTFQTAGNYGIDADSTNGSNASVVAVGDFNGDGKPDLVTANSGRNDVSVLLGNGNGNGTFQTAVNYDVHGYPDSYPYPYYVG